MSLPAALVLTLRRSFEGTQEGPADVAGAGADHAEIALEPSPRGFVRRLHADLDLDTTALVASRHDADGPGHLDVLPGSVNDANSCADPTCTKGISSCQTLPMAPTTTSRGGSSARTLNPGRSGEDLQVVQAKRSCRSFSTQLRR